MTQEDRDLGITEDDLERFGAPCVGDRRCAIEGPHTGLDHLRIGLREAQASR